MRRPLAVIAAFLCLAVAFPARADVSDEDLARARAERERIQDELSRAANAYAQSLTAVEVTKQDIARTTDAVKQTQARRDEVRQLVLRRAVAAYKGERSGQLGAVLASRNMNDLVDRASYLQRATQSDTEAIDQLRATTKDLQLRQAELARFQAQQEEAVRRAEQLQHDLEGTLEEAKAQESTLIGQRAAEDEARRKAAEAEARRQAAEADAARRRAAEEQARRTGVAADLPAQSPVATVMGDFICPVAGPVAYSDDFGAPREGHTHQGNDLFAARGTPLVAVRSGSVVTQEGGAGGLMVFLYAGGDMFFYAHLESFTVDDGASVSQGQQVGTVGSSGNVDADATHLHFEIHPGGGAAVDPYPTISQVC